MSNFRHDTAQLPAPPPFAHLHHEVSGFLSPPLCRSCRAIASSNFMAQKARLLAHHQAPAFAFCALLKPQAAPARSSGEICRVPRLCASGTFTTGAVGGVGLRPDVPRDQSHALDPPDRHGYRTPLTSHLLLRQARPAHSLSPRQSVTALTWSPLGHAEPPPIRRDCSVGTVAESQPVWCLAIDFRRHPNSTAAPEGAEGPPSVRGLPHQRRPSPA